MFVRRTHRSFPSFCKFAALAVYLICSIDPTTLRAQTPQPSTAPQKPQADGHQTQNGGVNTGGTHPAVLDKEHRPITAGGFVKSGPIIFQDIAQKAGLTTWKHTMGTPEKPYIVESNGSGVSLIDYDNDGWLDIYIANGSTADARLGRPALKLRCFTTTRRPSPTSP
jgi:hypothetical protein